jgi:hypothetical protein
MSERVGIVVDGDGDFAALRKRFGSSFRVLKTDGPRGHTARPAEIAKRARKQIGILRGYRCAKVIVMLDFERRSQTYEAFVQSLSGSFSAVDFGLPVRVVVPNRMIENWYLADIEHLSAKKAFLKANLKQKNYEGCDGKAQVKRLMRSPHTYRETTHGPQMFAILRFPVARQHSPSFDVFLGLIGGG